MKRHGGSLNHPKGNMREDGGRDDKTNVSRVALSAYPKTTFWAYARASLRPRILVVSTCMSEVHHTARRHSRRELV